MSAVSLKIKLVDSVELISVSLWELVAAGREGLEKLLFDLSFTSDFIGDEEGVWEVGPFVTLDVYLDSVDSKVPNNVILKLSGLREWSQITDCYEEEG